MLKLKMVTITASILVLACSCDRDGSAGADAEAMVSSAGEVTNATLITNHVVSPTQDADNTERNVRDRYDANVTPLDQGESESDREITRQIRRAITANDQLSVNAKNIKIITVNGKVTLRGPVENEQEMKTITAAASGASGVSAIDNQLDVPKR